MAEESSAAEEGAIAEKGGNWIRRDGDGATVGVAPAEPAAVKNPRREMPSAKPAAPNLASTTMTPLEEQIFQLTNQFRKKNRLPLLLPEPGLVATARAHSIDMQARGYFGHVNPDGKSSDARIGQAHRSLIGSHGENIWRGRGYSQEPEAIAKIIVDSWIESPQHRRNMLRPKYTHLGIGVASQGRDIYATQNFSEAWAYLKNPLPHTLRLADLGAGKFPSTAVTPFGRRGQASFYELRGSNNRPAMDPVPVGQNQPIALKPGTYRLFLHFLESESRGRRNYSVVTGPLLQVR